MTTPLVEISRDSKVTVNAPRIRPSTTPLFWETVDDWNTKSASTQIAGPRPFSEDAIAISHQRHPISKR